MALFSDDAAELRFRQEEKPANSKINEREVFTEEELKLFLNQYNDIAVNPCSESEIVLTAAALRENLN